MRKSILALFIISASFGTHDLLAQKAINPQKFNKIIESYEKSLFDYSPEIALFLGRNDIPQDKFRDNSLEGIHHWQKQEDYYLNTLNEIDPSSLIGSPEYITYWLMKENLEYSKEARVCKEELWHVNPAVGWQNMVTDIASKQPVGNPAKRAMAIKRWNQFPQLVHNEMRNLKKGVSVGYVASKPTVERVLKQIQFLINDNVTESPFYELAKHDTDEAFKEVIANLIKTKINPALQEYAAYLEVDYIGRAREEIGVSALPSAEHCYQAKIRQFSTVQKSPESIHQIGLREMERLKTEVAEIGDRLYGLKDMTEVFHRAKSESQHFFKTEQDIIDYNMLSLQRVKNEVSKWFDLMPQSDAIVKPYPTHRAQTGASGEYHAPSDDGSTPGIFYINAYEPEKISRIDQQSTLFHELIPGHHFQIALHHENKDLAFINRYLTNSGFIEGWALYAERLADSMGVYDDDISRLGMLSNESMRIARLVVDTGIHSMHWTRQQAVDYLREHTAIKESIIEGEIDRYIAWPGQATSYMLGKLEIERLRDMAKDELGNEFSIKEFHNQVLKNGAVTLTMLREQIMHWLNTRR